MAVDRRVLVVVAVVLAALTPAVIAFVADDDGPTSGPPFDPRSTDDDGTRAFVRVLEEVGIEVEVRPADVDPGDATVVLFEDLFLDDERADLLDWVRGGGDLVALDPFSRLARRMRPVGAGAGALDADAPCELPGLSRVRDVDLSASLVVVPGLDDLRCLAVDDEVLVVERQLDAGTITTAGVRSLLVNRSIGDRDHAAVAVGLVGSAERVVVLDAAAPGSGDRSLLDLLPSGVVLAIVQLLAVAVVEMIRRSRRLGRVLPDEAGIIGPAVAPLDAAARLRARSGDRDGALGDLRRDLAHHLGVDDLAAAPDYVVARLARDAEVPLQLARAATAPSVTPDDATLVEQGAALAAMTDVAARTRLPEEIRP